MKKEIEVRFQRFVSGEGFTWRDGSEGIVIAETESFYKIKTGWLFLEWVRKDKCEVITRH